MKSIAPFFLERGRKEKAKMLYNKLFACRCKNGAAGIHHPQIRLTPTARWMPLEKAVEYGVLTAENAAEVISDLVVALDAATHTGEFSDFPTVYYEYPPVEEGGAENE